MSYGGPERRQGVGDRRESVVLEYIRGFFVKVLENMSSVKVWFFIWPFIVSSIYMAWIIQQQIFFVDKMLELSSIEPSVLSAIQNSYKVMTDAFSGWCVFNVSLTGTIVVVRETFKVSKLKALHATDNSVTVKKVSV